MANIKSQKKRAITNEKKHQANSAEKSRLKTALKKAAKAIEANDKEAALKAVNECNSLLDKAQSSHIKHKNYVARQKSSLAKSLRKLG